MSTLEVKELSHPAGQVIKIASGKTLDLKSQGTTTLPTGSVLQVVSVNQTSQVIISTIYTWTAVGLEATITPSSTSSKILVTVCGSQYTDVNDQTAAATIFRGSTNLGHVNYGFMPTYYNVGGGSTYDVQMVCSATYLDSPSTASAVTYSVKARTDKNTYRWNGLRSAVATITLTEIQG